MAVGAGGAGLHHGRVTAAVTDAGLVGQGIEAAGEGLREDGVEASREEESGKEEERPRVAAAGRFVGGGGGHELQTARATANVHPAKVHTL